MTCNADSRRELWIAGVEPGSGRENILQEYLSKGGYVSRVSSLHDFDSSRPLGIVLDVSPFSDDGWGELVRIKSSPETRNIPVLPVFLSEKGKVGGVFPVAGFFAMPLDEEHFKNRLVTYGLTEDAETWDLHALVVSRSGEEKLSRAVGSLNFEVVKGYTGMEGLALASIHPMYLVFCSQMLPDMSAFEFQEKLKLDPYNSNTPVFVMLKDCMKDGEKRAMSREIAHLVRKKQLSCEEFLAYLRRRE